MSGSLPACDYEKLTIAQLDAAAHSTTMEKRRTHLDQAGIYAALGERARAFALSDDEEGQALRRINPPPR
ncbi:MAG: hypothetical protein EOO77_03925 [Oxalobacteraceae bacterium]|nr:MAG: hypothetical protein EOO77_03925 [Oxalobacteraceae bacterium]